MTLAAHHEQLRDAVRKWVDRSYGFERRRHITKAGGFDRGAYGELAELGLTGDALVICGMAVGYADPDAVVNTFQPARIPVEEYARFHD